MKWTYLTENQKPNRKKNQYLAWKKKQKTMTYIRVLTNFITLKTNFAMALFFLSCFLH